MSDFLAQGAKASKKADAALTPSDVLARAKANVEHMAKGGPLTVAGEVWDYKQIKGGHWTFDLKDKRAGLPCIVFFNDTKRIKFELKHGMTVVVTGAPSITQWAKLQLRVLTVDPSGGEGALDLAFRQLKEKLERDGLFAPERKRALPFLPRTIGVVTSSTGAALRDVLKVLFARMPRLRVIVSPTKVQGDGASADVADALRRLDRTGLCDVILLVRGGGSLEDLWAFNTEPVARVIAASTAPVIAGVGHETDTTIADLVADKRAATPSNAAEIAVPITLDELTHRVDAHARRLTSLARHAIAAARVRLDRQRKRLVDPRHLVGRRRRAVDELAARLERALRKRRESGAQRLAKLEQRLRALSPEKQLNERRARLASLSARLRPAVDARRAKRARALDVAVARLESISPLKVLARGYAIARRADDGAVVRDPSQVASGTKLSIHVEHGDVKATVD